MNETLNQTINSTLTNTSDKIPHFLGLNVPFTGYSVLDIFLISLFAAIFITMVNKYLTDQEKIKELRAEMKKLRKKQREVMKENNPKKMKEFQQKMMSKSMENMKQTMSPKVMITTMIPMFLLLGAVRTGYGNIGVILDLGFVSFKWLGTYIIFSIINSILMKKILKVA